MISICIPIYNHDACALIKDLEAQMRQLSVASELILIDDGSEEKYRKIHSEFSTTHTYIQLTENIGRAKIRNRFLQSVRFDHLLFLDCDGIVISETFLSEYCEKIRSNPNAVICGGRTYPPKLPSPSQSLRWYYGILRESKNADARSQAPYQSFMTNNVVIPKSVLDKIPFNETLRGYGHEDTIFGLELFQHHISILHISNPVLNNDIETNEVFLKKTEEGIKNLVVLTQLFSNIRTVEKQVQLVRLAFTLKRLRLSGLMLLLFSQYEKTLRNYLIRDGKTQWKFAFYKLGLFLRFYNSKK